jgi:hypothetical protein
MSAGDSYMRQIILAARRGANLIFGKGEELSKFYKFSYHQKRGEMAEFKNAIQWPNSETGCGKLLKSKHFFLPLHFPDGEQDLAKVKWISLVCDTLFLLRRCLLLFWAVPLSYVVQTNVH